MTYDWAETYIWLLWELFRFLLPYLVLFFVLYLMVKGFRRFLITRV